MNVMRYTIEVASLCLRLFPWHLACQETIVKVAHMAPAAQSTASDHDLGEAWGLRAIRVEALSLCRPVFRRLQRSSTSTSSSHLPTVQAGVAR